MLQFLKYSWFQFLAQTTGSSLKKVQSLWPSIHGIVGATFPGEEWAMYNIIHSLPCSAVENLHYSSNSNVSASDPALILF
jgi:hypothetical protein